MKNRPLFLYETNTPTGWFHMAMVYHGVGAGISAYIDGAKIATVTAASSNAKPTGNGEVVIGRRVLQSATNYATTYVDEFKMYNRQLSDTEILNMY